ncbi:MFS transporter [Saccharopolyspora griseoalba]|uniref:MFS transporter n=1 Tax=Saccharopolyspora griseoalba TaxID=1431848 RepID=A0ABW2LLT2_9PSEU
MSLADYRRALSTPGARVPVLASLLGRWPIAMFAMALLLYVQRVSSSFAIAGMMSAGALIGVAAGSVVQGRIMDRVGPSLPLYVASALFVVAVAATITSIEAHAPAAISVGLSFLLGMTQPNVSSASRAMWEHLLPPGRVREAAVSYEAISLEVFFILGPGVAALLVATPWPGLGLLVAASCMVVGGVWFASTRASRTRRPEPGQHSGDVLGALAAPGMRTVALAAGGFGLLIGYIEVAVPAAAVDAGVPTAGGLLISLMSVSSVLVGLVYGVRPWPRPMHLRLPALLAGFALLIALLAAPSSLWGLCVALLAAGCLITPQSTAHSVAIEVAAPRGKAAEAFGWVVTSVTLGSAIGHSTSGQLVEIGGPKSTFLVAAVVGLLITALLWRRRATLLPARERSELVLAAE